MPKNKYNWVQFSQSYLLIARLACQEILDPHHSKFKFRLSSKLKYKSSDIYISIIYNIKHGIEIFIKTLKLILAEKLNKDDKSHNTSELFDLLKKEIKKHKIVEVIRQKYMANSDDINLELAYNNKLKIDDFLNDLEKFIKKYHYCEIIKDKLNSNFSIEDIDNTVFRYPENNLKINLDYEKILEKINQSDIEEIFKDIEQLLKNFNELGFVLEIYKKQIKKSK